LKKKLFFRKLKFFLIGTPFLAEAGLPDFSGAKYQKRKNIPNYHELYLMFIKYNKRP
jgi:hypothetical protein